MVADATAAGRLLVDLEEVELSLSTPLALLEPGSLPILPDPLPSSLNAEGDTDEAMPMPGLESCEITDELQGIIPGPTFDASVLETVEEQAHFHRNLAAVTDVLTGQKLRRVAQARGIAPATLSRLVQRTKQLGQIACVPHGAYHRERPLHPAFQQLIRKLYTHRMRPTMMAVAEDVRLKRLAAELSEREGRLVKTPTYRQVQYFLKGIAQEATVTEARSGLKHPPRERMSTQSFVLSIAYPAHICQVDEHTLDHCW